MKGCHHVKFNLKAAMAGVAGAATLAFAAGGLVSLAAPAYAAPSAPPYEPDSNSAPPYGNIIFYNANGQEVTSGTSLSSPFAYAIATTAPDTNATKATLYFADPVSGELPANWNSTTEAGPTTDTAAGLGSSTPADVLGYVGSYPIVNASAADVTTWLGANPSSTVTGYVDTIQVRLQDSGANNAGNASGTYWSSDIAYNTTSSAVTLDGVSVPADGWAQVFPIVNPSSVTLTTSATGGQLTSGSSITLTATATTTPTGQPGLVQFYDGTTFLADSSVGTGPFIYSYTPAVGPHTYQAYFVPETPGDPAGANTSSASIVGGSASSAVSVTDSAPLIGTSTALSASSTGIAYGASDTFTATVTESDAPATAGLAGSVQFYDGTSTLGSPVTTTVGTASSTAQLTTSALPSGTDEITATFTPSDTAYGSSSSPQVAVTVAAPAACSLTGSSCTDQQNIQVTVNAGTITITTPYTSTNPFVLPALTLSSDGTYLQSSATFPASTNPSAQQIVVTSQLAGDPSWTLSVSASNLTNGSGGTIPSSGLGLTNGALLATTPAFPGGVTFTNIAAHNPSPVDTDTNTGLTSAPQTWATSPAGNGTAVLDGTLTLYALTSTPAGTYSGTITFSVV
jgi:hypothetical protein